MSARSLIIGTRASSLALCQTQIIQTKLEEKFPGASFTVQPIKAYADKNPELSLVALGGEGVFVKELETALFHGEIDFAVHSMKDLPLDIPEKLCIAAVLEREEPRDALVSISAKSLSALPDGSRIGTSSLRRRSQLLHARPGLRMADIRGNVDTRLRKLQEGEYDAIIVAACGLIRLGLEKRISECLNLATMLPEPGQGALVVEARRGDREILEMLRVLNDASSRACVEAERAFLRALGGGCRVPIAAYASLRENVLELEGAVISPDGRKKLRESLSGAVAKPIELGERLAQGLIEQGARDLLLKI